MDESIPDSESIQKNFEELSKQWIETSYNWFKKKGSTRKIDEEEHARLNLIKPNLQNFIRTTLTSFISKWTETSIFELFPEFFNSFIKNLFEKKQDELQPLYQLGDIYRAFINITQFKILVKTIKTIKKKLLEGKCDLKWVDPTFLQGYYKQLSNVEEKKLKFFVRNLVLLAIRNNEREVKDVKINCRTA